MRRNRRQPERLELSGTLRQHKANVWVALDMSGSITDAEFTNALEQVLQIVHAYNHRITIVECDNEVRRTYTMETVKDVKPRLDVRGSTAFSPVFSLANQHHVRFTRILYGWERRRPPSRSAKRLQSTLGPYGL